jgi:hypothetical protein
MALLDGEEEHIKRAVREIAYEVLQKVMEPVLLKLMDEVKGTNGKHHTGGAIGAKEFVHGSFLSPEYPHILPAVDKAFKETQEHDQTKTKGTTVTVDARPDQGHRVQFSKGRLHDVLSDRIKREGVTKPRKD